MFYADLDGLKHINDTLGHEAGDEAIAAGAAVLASAFRADDLIGRLGGDELAVVLLDTEASQMPALLAGLDESIALFNQESARGWSLAMSAGWVSTRKGQSSTIQVLLDEADDQMYAIKRARKRARA